MFDISYQTNILLTYLVVHFKMNQLKELLEKEKSYVEKLGKAKKYEDYLERSKTDQNLIQMPENFVGKEQFVFNNLDKGIFLQRKSFKNRNQ